LAAVAAGLRAYRPHSAHSFVVRSRLPNYCWCTCRPSVTATVESGIRSGQPVRLPRRTQLTTNWLGERSPSSWWRRARGLSASIRRLRCTRS